MTKNAEETGSPYSWHSLKNEWIRRDGSMKMISVGSMTDVWGLNTENVLHRYDFHTQKWIVKDRMPPGQQQQSLSVGADGTLFSFGPDSSKMKHVKGRQVGTGPSRDD